MFRGQLCVAEHLHHPLHRAGRSAAERLAGSIITAINITLYSSFLPLNNADASLAFYRDTLGFKVRNDFCYEGMRWITVGLEGQPGLCLPIVLHLPTVGTSITDDEHRTITEMMVKGRYASNILITKDLEEPRRHPSSGSR